MRERAPLRQAFSVIRTLLSGGALLAVGPAGCTFTPGEPFAELTTELAARYTDDPARATEMGWQKLASGYDLQLTRAELTVKTVQLFAAAGARSAFDPARPPAGYSACHGGHCHAADGRLVSYEEIAAEQSGGKVAPPVLQQGGGTLDLLAGATLRPTCPPPCQVGHGTLTRLRLVLARLELAGIVRDGGGDPRIPPTRFAFTLSPEADGELPPLDIPIDVPADNEHDPFVALRAEATFTAALLDDVAWAKLPISVGAFVPAAADRATIVEPVHERLVETPVAVDVTRHGVRP